MEPRSVYISYLRGSAGYPIGIADTEDRAVIVRKGNVQCGAIVPLEAARVLEQFYGVDDKSFADRRKVAKTCSELKAQFGELLQSLGEARVYYLSWNGRVLGAWISNKALRDLVSCREEWAKRSGLTP